MSQNSVPKSFHSMTAQESMNSLDSSLHNGLSSEEVQARQGLHGPNRLTSKKQKHPLILFLEQFNQALIYILLVACLVTGYLREWLDCSVIFAVVLVNSIIGFIQESKALKAINSLVNSLSCEAKVLRSGIRHRISADELIPGDIIYLSSGDKVPADVRVLKATQLYSDESMLTGESLPTAKHEKSLDANTLLADRRNMLYSGAHITGGQGIALVTDIAHQTEIGKISDTINNIIPLATPLTRKIKKFSTTLMYFILLMAAITFIVGSLHGKNWTEMFMASIALAVGAIPEGLPAVVTITLAIGTNRMAAAKAIIRRLPAVESLGSTTVICSDKTGTLTQNCMTVKKIYAGGQVLSVTGEETLLASQFECLKIGIICNDCHVQQLDESFQIDGNPTEKALIYGAIKSNMPIVNIAKYPRTESLPFDSHKKYMATIHREGNKYFLYAKGSFEHLVPYCKYTLNNDASHSPFDEKNLHGILDSLASEGMRVLAFVKKEISSSDSIENSFHELTFVGFQAMIDPPRLETAPAVKECQEAGVRVVMITGDHAGTAAAIAAKVGIVTDNFQRVMTGNQLSLLEGQEKIEAIVNTAVFARVEPIQKLEIVETFQKNGEIVAMTGDGVNDALALKRADIGIAMGKVGTEVARDSSDMVLADDNFASITAAVREGRGVYDNLIKFITWTLPTNLAEGMVIMGAILVGAALPILPVQILWTNMSTALCLGLMLAFEPKENNIMQRPPHSPGHRILDKGLIMRIFLVGFLLLLAVELVFYQVLSTGASLQAARTAAANMLVTGKIAYLFNCRTLKKPLLCNKLFSNPFLPFGVLLMLLLQLIFTYTGFMNQLFHTSTIGLSTWGLISCLSIGLILIVEFEKHYRNSRV
ncbi:HAD-IC family P-type ATPase [Lentisphaera marina]|uniref:cation-translocating P-type ATPase n=1 Tax=Lentisphaera marina TaxID=1111041 RepID=UPI002365DFCC|nr:HAD-IC family P-type ATPase [Lentisphaera marina]MDD7984347.1 HAD-IC family P-type ATPase [Lentisphaera marina]